MALGTLSVFVIFSMLLLGPVTVSQFAFADGGGPNICKGGPTDNTANEPTIITSVDAILFICIKDGSMAFGPDNKDQHSGLITQDTDDMDSSTNYGTNDCYTVQGMGTMMVTVDNVCGGMGISHVDYFVEGGVPPGSFVPVGGEFIGIDTTAVLAAGAQNIAAWMIPVIIATAGLGIVIARKF